jgi:uncharacterized membrane protein
MPTIGRFHPLLIHFPIALFTVAVAAELAAALTACERWQMVAAINVRVGALFAAIAAAAGWRMADGSAGMLLDRHRWVGTVAAIACVMAAALSQLPLRGCRRLWIYRTALFTAALLIGIAAHFGGQLVWGTDFLQP